MSPIRLGIDLGTTRTVVALADRGNYPVLPFSHGGDDHFYLPSLSALTASGLVHGFEARDAHRAGAPLIRSLKRLLAAPDVTWCTPMPVGDTELPVGHVLTEYLRYLRVQIEAMPELDGVRLDNPDPEALTVAVAVPAHALGAQRMLTLDAFAAAGIRVSLMLHEPSAAGFEYTHRRASTISSRRTRVLVYDLGGGTFDTSLVDAAGGAHAVIASRGLSDLGGDDIDLVIAEMALAAAGVAEASLSDHELTELLAQCQEAKESLAPQTRRMVIEVAGTPVVLPTSEVYAACQPLIDRSVALMAPLVEGLEIPDAGASDGPDAAPSAAAGLEEVAGIYLVGGASAFPPVGRTLRERYGRRVHRSPYPGSSTAIGLAIAADPESGVSLTERLSRSFGVFREEEGGTRVSFDPILLPDAVTASVLPGESGSEPTVIVREYQAAHTMAHYRFLECEGVDDRGEPTGRTAPYDEVYFPLTPDLAGLSDAELAQVSVERVENGPRVREVYEVDATGQVRVTVTDLTHGLTRTVELGR